MDAIEKTAANFRLLCVVQTVELLREAIERNRNVYSGSLVPNLQSVSDMCVLPYPMLVEGVALFPPMVERLKMADFWPPPQEGN